MTTRERCYLFRRDAQLTVVVHACMLLGLHAIFSCLSFDSHLFIVGHIMKRGREDEDSDWRPEDDVVSLQDSVVAIGDETMHSTPGTMSVNCEDSSVELVVSTSSDTEVESHLPASVSPVALSPIIDDEPECPEIDIVYGDTSHNLTFPCDSEQERTVDCSLLVLENSTADVSSSSHNVFKECDKHHEIPAPTLQPGPDSLADSDDDDEYVLSDCEVSSVKLCDLDEEDIELPSNLPLYTHAPLSVDDSMIAILSFVIRHNLSGSCIIDLLKLISLHLPPENNMKTSMYFFKKHFSNLNIPVKYHYFCSECCSELIDGKSPCPNANEHTNVNAGKSYFIEIPLIPQLQSLFKRKGFSESIHHRFSRKKVQAGNIEDIYDGQLYKEQVENGFLTEDNRHNISLMWNSDGVPVFRSSNSSLWPVYFSINELPYSMRHRKENILLGGLWFGKKPHGNILLEPFIASLKEIRKGFDVQLPDVESPVKVHGILLCGTCDLPATSMFMRMVQFNGAWGCHVCKAKGESVSIEPKKKKETAKQQINSENGEGNNLVRKPSVWVYKYDRNIELRQHSETILLGEQAHQQMLETQVEQNVLGIKGPSVLSKIIVDVIRGTAIDIMHSGFLGVVKKLLDLMFNSKYKNEMWSVHDVLPVLDRRLLNIRPPNFVQRGVRSLTQYNHWKASELKSWIYYYCIPVLEGFLPHVYMENLIDLVSSLYKLNTSSITPEEIISCGIMLDRFVSTFQNLYGVRHMSMNVHLMLHLTFVVVNLGPLWCYSCFAYENLNGLLLRMIHGTTHVETQLASCAYLVTNLPHVFESMHSESVKQCCRSFLRPSSKLKKLEDIDTGIFSVGVYKHMIAAPNLVKEMLLLDHGTTVHCQSFLRLKKGNFLFVARSYARTCKTISFVTSFRDTLLRRFGLIEQFFRVSSCECNTTCECKPAKFLALLEVLDVTNWCESIEFMHQYALSGIYVVIPVECLESMHFSVSNENHDFLCEPVNSLEVE